MAKIRERRKELGKVFLDIGKYLFTTIAIGSLISEDVNLLTVMVAFLASAFILVIGFYITPTDEEK